ncbi:MAG: FAD-dependent oxidoreductase [Gaiellales bacterium]
MEPERHDVIVVGAGIAGLAAAWDLRDRDIVILERGNRVGGRIRSEARGDLWLNLGAHVYAGDDSATGRLMIEAGATPRDIPGVLTAVSYKGRLVADGPLELYPFKLPISMRGRAAFVRTGLRLRRLVAEYGRMAAPRPGDTPSALQQRMLDYLPDRSFTQELGVLQPEVDAFFRCTLTRGTGEPEQIAAGYGVGYFHLAWNQEDGLGRNIVGGPQTLIDALAAPHADRIRYGAVVTRITQGADGVTVEVDENGARRTLRARAAIVSTPSHVAAEIVEGIPAETDAALRAITYGPMISAAFLTDEEGPQRWDGIYAIATPGRATSMLFNMGNVLMPQRARGSSFMSYASANLARRIMGESDETILDTYQAELEGVFPELRGHVVERLLHRVDPGIPYPFVGRNRIQEALLAPLGRVHLCGDYLGTWYADTSVWTGRAAAAVARGQ